MHTHIITMVFANMKKFAFIALTSFLIFGCKTNPQNQTYFDNETVNTNILMQTEFNDEIYVWENFIFSTNRVDNSGK